MKADEETLARFARASQQGDRRAYSALLDASSKWLLRYYSRRIAQDQLDDLVQETLMSVHRKLASYEHSRPFLPWLAAIARYRWVDALRKSYRRQETSIDGYDFAGETDHEVVAARMSLERLFAYLPDGQSRVIELVKIDGLSIAEAAERCGQSEALVKINIHRGLKKLQALVEKAN